LSPEKIKEIQCVIGSILYYACTVDIIVLMALSSIAIEQTKGTTSMMEKAKQLHFFMGWATKDGTLIKLNGAFFTLCAILCFVITSAAEAKLGALFLNCKEGMIF
jgi:hypothetical protein